MQFKFTLSFVHFWQKYKIKAAAIATVENIQPKFTGQKRLLLRWERSCLVAAWRELGATKLLDGAVLVRDGRGQAAGNDDSKDLKQTEPNELFDVQLG